MSAARRVASEFLGTAFLLAVVVGSGIMGERLSAGNTAVALLANSLATGAGLAALILSFGPISGAHFNPVVSLSELWQGKLSRRAAAAYVAAQMLGAFAGVAAAHLMFAEPVFFASGHVRNGWPQWWSELVATFGLIGVIISCSRTRPGIVPFAVAAYITAAYWFTASTSFANPAVTLARAASNTFAGIRPADTVGFIVAQFAGCILATLVFDWLCPHTSADLPTVAGTMPPRNELNNGN